MSQTSSQSKPNPQELKSKIEKVLSEILSDKHNAKITLKFTKKEEQAS